MARARATAARTKKPGTVYTKKLAEDICRRIEDGATLDQIEQIAGMPTKRTIGNWKRTRAEFAQMLWDARIEQARTWADEIITLSDDATADWRLELKNPKFDRHAGEDGNDYWLVPVEKPLYVAFDRKHLERAKLQVQTRQWLMPRIDPDSFSERHKVDVSHSYEDKDDGELIHALRTAMEQSGLSAAQLVALLEGGGKDARQ